MRSVFKAETAQVGYAVVSVLVTRFLNSFGFSTKPDPLQIELITVDTLEKFSYESLEDVVLFFKMARSGGFGTTKRGIDSNLIYGKWYPMYLDKKAELREQNYQKEKGDTSRTQATDEDVNATYKKIHDENFEKRVSNYVDQITIDFDRQMLEDLIIDWNKDPERKPYIDLLKIKRKTIK